ncbi:MAG: LysM peptidoglycan-binding domain-containing protein [Nitrospirae bacterium]|nr:MAG: LysM peptidoglycan-binding domain-containing protein [Nitrospirota bacterium]
MLRATLLRIFLAVSVSVCFLCMGSVSSASVTYVIKKGDTPSSIAKKHKIPVQTLLSANKIKASTMKIGTSIIVPTRTAEAAVAKHKHAGKAKKAVAKTKSLKTEPSVTESAGQARPSQDNPYHTIKKGDTLASISRKYSVSVDELKGLNNLRSKKLRTGQKLLVRHMGPKTYTVKKGDTIRKIAKKFDMDSEDLITLNELDIHELYIGQTLYLEEKLDETSAEQFQQAMGRNIEEEIKKVAATQEFEEKPTQDKVTTFAKKMLNIPYKFGGTSILGIDCSGYVRKVYGFLGVNLPRTAREQFKEGEAIDREELSIGDLVFFRTYASFPSHVGIYLGNNLFIHASSKGRRVTIDSLETPYYLKRFIGGKRLLTETEQEPDPKG